MRDQLKKTGNGVLCPMAIMIQDGKVLTGHRHYTPDKWKSISVWITPGGRSDFNETIEQTLRREVAEEVGINKFEILNFIGEVAGGKTGDIVLLFYCTTQQEAQLMEPDKFSEWKWVPIPEFISDPKYLNFNPPQRTMVVNYLSAKKSNLWARWESNPQPSP